MLAPCRRVNDRLREGLASLAKEHGIAIRQSGPPQMPLMLFEADADVRKGRAFCSAALRHGTFFHPQHNMFLSLAHRPADIDEALQAASHGFKAVHDLEARSNR
jgi:glutamate-1-semialdehyde 2,1-aminomutase